VRFEFMLTKGNAVKDLKSEFTGKTILDIGCGYADLYKYFMDSGIKLKSYTGVDLVEKAIKMCKRKYPEMFEVRDVVENPYPDNSFDYVFGVGIFALKCDDYLKYVQSMLNSMYKMCRIEAAANFAMGNSSGDKGEFIAVQPDTIKKLVEGSITTNAEIKIDKTTQEFTIFLRK